ncbi:MAG: Hpt domain-containing protein, partial [Planctomycetes bacterium]|nr:Hpt domain-containing protein [Planctomycetota bacterium]
LAHTLKGVAGNIGAGGLLQLAAKLEAAIKAQQPREKLNRHLQVLTQPLASLIARLEEKLPPEVGPQTVAVDREQLFSVCSKMEALLADDDSAVGDLLDANSDLINSAFPAQYSQINNGIRSFDFEAALMALRAAMNSSPLGNPHMIRNHEKT